MQRWRTLPGTPDGYDYADVEFVELDLGDASSLSDALVGCDLVVHTAGPFQRKTRPEVLEAAIEAKVCACACACARVRCDSTGAFCSVRACLFSHHVLRFLPWGSTISTKGYACVGCEVASFLMCNRV